MVVWVGGGVLGHDVQGVGRGEGEGARKYLGAFSIMEGRWEES